MTAKEKAEQLIYMINIPVSCKVGHKMSIPISLHNEQKKAFALIVISEITQSLINYGNDTNELQNMDGELRWWDNVKSEIENYEPI